MSWGVPENQMSMSWEVPENQMSMSWEVPENQMSMSWGSMSWGMPENQMSMSWEVPENQMSDWVTKGEVSPMDDYCNKRWSELEEKDPSPLFRVARHPDDNLFLEQIERAEIGSKHPRRRRTSIQKLSKYKVVSFLRNHFDGWWTTFQEFSEAANDYTVYHNAVRAAATLVYRLFTEDFLFHLARSCTKKKELDRLWKNFVVMAKQGCKGDDVFESIVCDKIIKRYSSLTDCDVSDMLSYYITALDYPDTFDRPYEVKKTFSANEDEIEEDHIFEELMEVVSNMKPPQRMKVNDYTRMMIKFSTGCFGAYQEMLLVAVLDVVDIDALYNLEANSIPAKSSVEFSHEQIDFLIKDLLITLMFMFIEQIKKQLSSLVKPLEELDSFESLYISSSVFKVIEVAELRRSALGSRFISRKDLLWAFYECGYGLPPKIRQTVVLNTHDEDHPLYHVYLTALKLAEFNGSKMVGLEHLMFAVLYYEDEMQISFKDFLKEVTLDSEKRPKVECTESYFSDYGLLCHVTLKEMLTSPELQLVIDRLSSTMLL